MMNLESFSNSSFIDWERINPERESFSISMQEPIHPFSLSFEPTIREQADSVIRECHGVVHAFIRQYGQNPDTLIMNREQLHRIMSSHPFTYIQDVENVTFQGCKVIVGDVPSVLAAITSDQQVALERETNDFRYQSPPMRRIRRDDQYEFMHSCPI